MQCHNFLSKEEINEKKKLSFVAIEKENRACLQKLIQQWKMETK